MPKLKPVLAIIGLTLGVFLLTKNPFTASFSLQMTLIALLALLFYGYLVKKKGEVITETKAFIFLLTTFILFLIAATGWFFSPFFFSLYLLGIVLAFVLSPAVSAGFIATLVGLFTINVGEVDLAYDFLVILSLLTVIPLSFYLSREYLRLKEAEKKILVLEKKNGVYRNQIEKVLANVINNLAVNLRQPINDAKQLAYRLGKVKDKEKMEKNRQRIIASSEEALRLLKKFEEEATGKKLLSTPE